MLTVTRYVNGVEVKKEDLKNYTITNEVVLSNLARVRKRVMEEYQTKSNTKSKT